MRRNAFGRSSVMTFNCSRGDATAREDGRFNGIQSKTAPRHQRSFARSIYKVVKVADRFATSLTSRAQES